MKSLNGHSLVSSISPSVIRLHLLILFRSLINARNSQKNRQNLSSRADVKRAGEAFRERDWQREHADKYSFQLQGALPFVFFL